MSCLEDTASQSHSCFREYSDDRTKKNTDTCIIQYFKILLTSEK